MSELDTHELPTVERRKRHSAGVWAILAVAAAIFCVYLAMARQSRQPAEQHPAIGRHLPGLELQPLTGADQPVSLDDLKGQVVLLNFWGTWCPPCREEFPHLAALASRLSTEQNFRMLSVSCSHEGNDANLDELRDQTEKFLKKQGSDLPTYADQFARTRRSVVMALDDPNFGYPTTLVLDKLGAIRGVWVGYGSDVPTQIEQLVERLLHE